MPQNLILLQHKTLIRISNYHLFRLYLTQVSRVEIGELLDVILRELSEGYH